VSSRSRILVYVAAGVLFALSAWGFVGALNRDAGSGSGTQAPPGVENFGKTQSPPAQGQGTSGIAPILDFSAPALAGGTLSGADYSGKAVALWFWAPW
jgi:hypothetical protein